MANYETLKAAIQSVVKTNGNNEITGALLQQSLLAMINSLGSGYQFIGVATPDTKPGTPDQKVFYIAYEEGEYKNFSSNSGVLSVADIEIAIFKYNGTWVKEIIYQIDNYASIPIVEKKSNKYIGPNGAEMNSREFDIFLFNVEYCKKIYISSITGGAWNVFVNDNDVVVGSPFRFGNVYTQKYITQDVPSGAKYLKATQVQQTGFINVKGIGVANIIDLYEWKKDTINQLSEITLKLEKTEDDIVEIEGQIDSKIKPSGTLMGYIGNVSPYEFRIGTSGNSWVGIFSVEGKNKISIKSDSGIDAGASYFSFFDNYEDFSTPIISDVHHYNSRGITNVNVPNNAKALVITCTFSRIGTIDDIIIRDLENNSIYDRLNKLEDEIPTNEFAGKSIDFEGDSITAARAADGGVGFCRAADELKMNWINNGSSGASTTTTKLNSICTLVQSRGQYDYMIVQPSTVNDESTVVMGSLSDEYKPISEDYDTTTYYGALEQIARYLVLNQKKYGMIISYRNGNSAIGNNNTTRPQAIRDVCEKWSIPYIDLAKKSGFNLIQIEQRKRYGRYDGSVQLYDEQSGYAEDEIVKHLSSLYKAKEAINAPAGVWDESKWTQISSGDDYDSVHCNNVAYELMKNKIKEFIKSL